jgi:predicted nucleic acid-binding protein
MVIDTTIFVEYLRSKDKAKTSFTNLPPADTYFYSAVTKFELYSGATDAQKWKEVENLLAPMSELPFRDEISIDAARIYQDLRSRGLLIEFRDIFIAATARYHHLPLKTLNVKDFSRIPGLQLV